MRENFKIEKELLFKNNIKEITSISLDRDYKIEKDEIIGNFVINGDYKIHEVSINREKFNFKIPFKHSITSDIDETTLDLEITDFSYDYNKDELMVNIEYELTGDRKDILIFDSEETLDEFLNKREVEVIDTRIDSIKEEIKNLDEEKDLLKEQDEIIIPNENTEETVKLILPTEKEKTSVLVCEEKKDKEEVKEEKLDKKEMEKILYCENDNIRNEIKEENKEVEVRNDFINKEEIKDNVNINLVKDEERNIKTEEIINNVSTIQDKFITYKIYKVAENDTLESIVLKYHTSVEEIKEYNELSGISVGDKIIIPINE